jgi:hypothetical protein
MTNTYDLGGTPINIVQNVEYAGAARCSIYPIHHQHTLRIDQLLRADPLLVDACIGYEGEGSQINAIECQLQSDSIQVLAHQMALIEDCINRSVDQFLDESNGYFAVQA